MGAGHTPAEQRIDHGHLHRSGTDGVHRLGPGVRRLPDEPVGIQGSEPEQTLGGYGCENKMSQIGPYLSQKRPKTRLSSLQD
jgi:hypothetical protein